MAISKIFSLMLLSSLLLNAKAAELESSVQRVAEARTYREIHTPIPIRLEFREDPALLFQKPKTEWRSIHTEILTGTYMGKGFRKRINTYNIGSAFFRYDQPGFDEVEGGTEVGWHEGGTRVDGVNLPKMGFGDGRDMQWFGPVKISEMVFTKEGGESTDNIRKLTSFIYVLMEKQEEIKLGPILEVVEFPVSEVDGISCSRKGYTWKLSSVGCIKGEPYINRVIF